MTDVVQRGIIFQIKEPQVRLIIEVEDSFMGCIRVCGRTPFALTAVRAIFIGDSI